MFKPLTLFLALRYTRAKKRTHFISFITLTSVLGITLGVTALITVLSVMNGFESELRRRILGMTAHVTVTGFDGQLRNWQGLAKRLQGLEDLTGTAPFVEGQVMVTFQRRVSGTLLRGVLPGREHQVSAVVEHIDEGNLQALQPGEYGIILGAELGRYLGVSRGDKVTVITPRMTTTPAGILPRLKRFTVMGFFEVGMYEYDRNMVLVHLADASKLLRLEDAVSGLRLKLDDVFAAPKVAEALTRRLDRNYFVTDWTRLHSNFFKAIRMEKTVMFIILLLIVAVAAFNIVSTLVMVVTDKRADIAILRTQGMTPGAVMGVFILLGSIIGLVGTLAGVVGGVALALNVETLVPAIERLFGVHFLAADVYYISELPSELHWEDVWRISGMAFLLTLMATLYPAWHAAKVKPAEELRYE
ncbi:MAG: lipoprotein-releasing ABC transporter permease subunit [Methylohalobius sp. ZOD2]